MANVITFPGGRRAAVPAASSADAVLAEVAAVELELARARIRQINSETSQANILWVWYCFKKCLWLAFTLWVISVFAGGAKAEPFQTRSFYNERGSFAGSSVSRGNSASFYDGRGSFSGSAIQHGNSTSFYDGRGHFTGSSVNTGPRR
jgi:hypothetical protein